MKRLFFIIFLLSVVTSLDAMGQGSPDPFRIGATIPDMLFTGVEDTTVQQLSLSDFRGRPFVLNIFSFGCAASIKQLPGTNDLYRSYKDRLGLFLIGLDFNDMIRTQYDFYRKRYQLHMPVAFDREYRTRHKIKSVPKFIWVDDKGVIRAVTNFISADLIEEFLSGKPLQAVDYSTSGREQLAAFNPVKPFLTDNNGGSDTEFLQRSLIARWKPGMPTYIDYDPSHFEQLTDQPVIQAMGRDLANLYRMAYFNRTMPWYPDDTVAYANYAFNPVLELDDTSRFVADYNAGKNLFCYSQYRNTAGSNSRSLEIMQRDLENFFGYVAVVETRQMKYLKLIVTDPREVVHSIGGKKEFSLVNGIHMKNMPVSELVMTLVHYNQSVMTDLPIINATGITGNIDITLTAVLSDLSDVRHGLQRSGFDLVEAERDMKVIVIRDAHAQRP